MTNKIAEAIAETLKGHPDSGRTGDAPNVVDALIYIGDALHRFADLQEIQIAELSRVFDEDEYKAEH